ncbi:TetR/AcrR family transcriptional regulator [Aestuariivita sp.]|jgi:AcrR family transcriptional regulator|uniref:TetR/AcrR family transcriptional regulator n=1 Tax=Aestuariivita sp. TaxID=1872407 RepID=UPI00216E9F1A|nr:TetR/AcrR family transcriptional regulator [Aestuariivita sp.]MCE8008876.1 TetR/AcrR family transcriptional regulator [Aestuariivita sp.]
MKDLSPDPKLNAILDAAWHAFATYGFRKTSMDDIARGAAMSRPALYLHYPNKEAIFRSLVQFYYDTASEGVEAALQSSGMPGDVLAAAFEAQTGEVVEMMLNSPHGHELLDTGAAAASDIKEAGETRLRGLYADWLVREAAAGHIRLFAPASDVAATISSALKGLKDSGMDYTTLSARLAVLAQILGAGLRTA